MRLAAADESGASTNEWVVAAAIVGLFAIPVALLINSGAEQRSVDVARSIESPDDGESSDVYSNPGMAGTLAADKLAGTAAVASVGLGEDKGVGIDLSQIDLGGEPARGRQVVVTRNGQIIVNGRRVEPGDSGIFGRKTADAPVERRLFRLSGADDGVNRTRPDAVERLRQSETVVSSMRAPDLGSVTTRPDVNLRPDTVASASATCPDVPPAKVVSVVGDGATMQIDRLPDDAARDKLGATLDRSRQDPGAGTLSAADPRCNRNSLITAAPDQLDDGTKLGLVRISANDDAVPSSRAVPMAPSAQIHATIVPEDYRSAGIGRSVEVNAALPAPSGLPVDFGTEAAFVDMGPAVPGVSAISVAVMAFSQTSAGVAEASSAVITLALAPETSMRDDLFMGTNILKSGR